MIWEIDEGPKPIEGLDEHGRADPAYAASLGLRPARAGMRVLATLIELIVALLLTIPAMIVLVPLLVTLLEGTFDPAVFTGSRLIWSIVGVSASQLLIIVFTIVQLVLHGRKGTTLGKSLFGIRSVNVRTLEAPRFWRGAVVRYLLGGAAFLVPFFGPVLMFALSPLFDPERRGRGWLDRAAATWFVDVRRGLDPYNVKRMRIARKELTAVYHTEKAPLPSLATAADADAPIAFVPTGRFSGGVLGAHRLLAAGADAAPGHPESLAAPGGALASGQAPTSTSVASPAAQVETAYPRPGHQHPDAALGAPSLITGVPSRADGVVPASATPAPAPVPVVPGPVVPAPDAPTPAAAHATPAHPASAPGLAVPAPVTPPALDTPPALAAASVNPAVAQAEAAGLPVRALLVLDTGQRIEVTATVLIGRSPSPADGEGTVQRIPLADESRSVSKTHLAVMPTRRGLIAVDRGSTNGSAVIRDATETPLTPGHPLPLRAGDTVRFGDRSLYVEHA